MFSNPPGRAGSGTMRMDHEWVRSLGLSVADLATRENDVDAATGFGAGRLVY